MTAADDRLRIMQSLVNGTAADREQAAQAAYSQHYAGAVDTRNSGVGSALAAGNVMQNDRAGASLAHDRNRFDSSYALEQAGDQIQFRRSDFAMEQARLKMLAAQPAPAQPYVFDPNAPNPWAITPPDFADDDKQRYIAALNAPQAPPQVTPYLPGNHPGSVLPQPYLPGGHPGAAPTPSPWYRRLRGPSARLTRGRQ